MGQAMLAAYLPGNSTVELRQAARPTPAPGQVLLAMKASTICGSDLRAIYREHLGEGAEAYRGVVAGHEPAGAIVAVGAGVDNSRIGERVVVYHISGCGLCEECRRGYQISCTAARRMAYGWQRDGGHAEYLVADERDVLRLPDNLTFLDGACVACGFGTAYEALRRVDVSGRDRVLIVGLGPVGVAAGLLAKALGARDVIGIDPTPERVRMALELSAVDSAADSDSIPLGTDVAVDCSGSGVGQLTALRHARRWGRVALVGEGGQLTVDVSKEIIHKQLTIHGSWVCSTVRMAELLELLSAWELHPEKIVSRSFPLEAAAEAYRVADAGIGGKVGLVWD